MSPRRKQSAAPSVSDEPSLDDWLRHNDARPISRTVDEHGYAIERWRVRGAMIVVLLYPKSRGIPGGWDILTSCGSTDIDRTLEDAEERIAASRGAT